MNKKNKNKNKNLKMVVYALLSWNDPHVVMSGD
jgi:hypothetical protein